MRAALHKLEVWRETLAFYLWVEQERLDCTKQAALYPNRQSPFLPGEHSRFNFIDISFFFFLSHTFLQQVT